MAFTELSFTSSHFFCQKLDFLSSDDNVFFFLKWEDGLARRGRYLNGVAISFCVC